MTFPYGNARPDPTLTVEFEALPIESADHRGWRIYRARYVPREKVEEGKKSRSLSNEGVDLTYGDKLNDGLATLVKSWKLMVPPDLLRNMNCEQLRFGGVLEILKNVLSFDFLPKLSRSTAGFLVSCIGIMLHYQKDSASKRLQRRRRRKNLDGCKYGLRDKNCFCSCGTCRKTSRRNDVELEEAKEAPITEDSRKRAEEGWAWWRRMQERAARMPPLQICSPRATKSECSLASFEPWRDERSTPIDSGEPGRTNESTRTENGVLEKATRYRPVRLKDERPRDVSKSERRTEASRNGKTKANVARSASTKTMRLGSASSRRKSNAIAKKLGERKFAKATKTRENCTEQRS
ncbi:hypothetical protein KM043_006223 [Ampulex compressa]|nr:hypothetical protein KM043_006223 [Ampulex compressa]